MAERQYSFTVQGWRWNEGKKEELRQAAVVAASPEDAIAEVQALLDPDGTLRGSNDRPAAWAVVNVAEINPKEAKDWIGWHGETSSPRQRADAAATAEAADIVTRKDQ